MPIQTESPKSKYLLSTNSVKTSYFSSQLSSMDHYWVKELPMLHSSIGDGKIDIHAPMMF